MKIYETGMASCENSIILRFNELFLTFSCDTFITNEVQNGKNHFKATLCDRHTHTNGIVPLCKLVEMNKFSLEKS